MKAKYRPVHHRAPNTTSTFVEPARQTTAWPGSSDFAQQLESKKQHLHHVPAAMMHDASVPFIEKQAAQGYQQQGYQQQGYQQQGYQQGYKDTGLKQEGFGNVAYTEAPVLYKSEQRPAVLKERILPIEEENIQPVVHRQIERREVHEVIQPIHEKQYLAPVIEEKQLPAESRQFGTYQPRVHTQLADTREYAATEHFKKTNAPIIEETIRKTIVEEVQPVVHRETVAPHIIKETLPIYERVIEPEVVLKETRPMMECCEPATFEKQVAVPSAPALPAQTFQEKTWTAQPLAQETKYVFEIQQKTKLIPQGTIPAEQTYSAPRYK